MDFYCPRINYECADPVRRSRTDLNERRIPALSEARVISVQMNAATIAFGGYSWPGVGQYEKITGVAYAEVDPADRRNSIIVDIGLAASV